MMSLQHSLSDRCVSTIRKTKQNSELRSGGCRSVQEQIPYTSLKGKEKKRRTTSHLLIQEHWQFCPVPLRYEIHEHQKSLCFCKAVN